MSVRWIGLDEFVRRLRNVWRARRLESNLRRITKGIKREIVREAPKVTRRLADSIIDRQRSQLVFEVVETAKHGLYVREQTREHPIFPVKKKALYWPGIKGGRPVAWALHPGSKADPYHERGVAAWESSAPRDLLQLARDITIELKV